MTTLFGITKLDTSYKEGPDSTFSHDGKEYSVDKVLALIRKKKLEPVELRTDKDHLGWILFEKTEQGEYVKDILDPDRMDKADTSIPVIVIKSKRYGLVIVDGTHRLYKAYFIEKKKKLPSYLLTDEEIKDCLA